MTAPLHPSKLSRKELLAAYYAANRDAALERGRAYYQKNKKRLRAAASLWRDKNRDRIREQQRIAYRKNRPKRLDDVKTRALKVLYGLSRKDFARMMLSSMGLCEICRRPEPTHGGRLCVDHDHKTGKARGLLCRACNTGLGMFRDSKNVLVLATGYLDDR